MRMIPMNNAQQLNICQSSFRARPAGVTADRVKGNIERDHQIPPRSSQVSDEL